ncbi:MAG: hypothetical protein A2511_15420 [Deltaproteobacteria bacterium RIFOXYD12_FULL_50_9]|nr:MAG: hypothetical protein A2511_15420 [Deltaproteobacteria bacterium RIFOXYD12_FULL_50_9]
MAFAEMSATCKNAIRSFAKTAHDKGRIDPPSAHHPDGAQIRRILIAFDTGSIRSGVTTPVTKKPKNSGCKFLLVHIYLFVASKDLDFKSED